MRVNAEKSADATHFWTLVLVVVLLLLIYRAPLLVLIPLATVFVSVELALDLLAILAREGYVGLFSGIEVYSTVVMYGAGIDYCMFLISRYKEELDGGATFEEATGESIAKVGAALAASAGTTMVGIGMMVFADFGKFRQAGVAMSFGLFFVLLASLTFTRRSCGCSAAGPSGRRCGANGLPSRPAGSRPRRSSRSWCNASGSPACGTGWDRRCSPGRGRSGWRAWR
jgi:uncharacterized membrane protein YdfJ with MMPL/SSD domain